MPCEQSEALNTWWQYALISLMVNCGKYCKFQDFKMFLSKTKNIEVFKNILSYIGLKFTLFKILEYLWYCHGEVKTVHFVAIAIFEKIINLATSNTTEAITLHHILNQRNLQYIILQGKNSWKFLNFQANTCTSVSPTCVWVPLEQWCHLAVPVEGEALHVQVRVDGEIHLYLHICLTCVWVSLEQWRHLAVPVEGEALHVQVRVDGEIHLYLHLSLTSVWVSLEQWCHLAVPVQGEALHVQVRIDREIPAHLSYLYPSLSGTVVPPGCPSREWSASCTGTRWRGCRGGSYCSPGPLYCAAPAHRQHWK